MKARLLKRLSRVIGIYLIPIGIVTLGLGSPSNANQQQSEVLTDVAKTPATTLQEISSQTATIEIEQKKQSNWGVGLLTDRGGQPLKWGVFVTEDSNGERVAEVNLGLEQLQDVIEALKTDHKSPSQSAAGLIADHALITRSLSGEEDAVKTPSGIQQKRKGTQWDQLDESEQQAIIEELEHTESDRDYNLDLNFARDPTNTLGDDFIVIIAMFFTVGLPFTITALVLFYKYRKRRQRDLLINKFIEAGKDVPVEILQENSKSGTPEGNLQRGVMLTGIGIGLYLFLGLFVGWGIASIALIPLFIGLARIVIWKLGATNMPADGAE